MNFCNKCGQQLENSILFCQKCGSKVEVSDGNEQIVNMESIKKDKYKPSKGHLLSLVVILLLFLIVTYTSKNKPNEQATVANNSNKATQQTPVANNDDMTKQKYNVKNLGTVTINDADFEQLYEKAKNSAFSWIDTLNEEDYLPANACSVTIFDDDSAAFILKTVDKKGIEDSSVLVTFNYVKSEKKWQRLTITYNKKEYGN